MRYVQVYESNSLGLYECDEGGHVHRHATIAQDVQRFNPEDVIFVNTVSVDYLVSRDDVTEINEAVFDGIWAEVRHKRSFLGRLTDPSKSYIGELEYRGISYMLRWRPEFSQRYTKVPGFDHLYVIGDVQVWKIQRAIFLETPIEWRPV